MTHHHVNVSDIVMRTISMGLTELILIGFGMLVAALWSMKNDKEDTDG